ncbi:MAG: 30S ribosomal protein S14 [Planctomycetota bacterium]|nr:30S ribosomal protein S14 [Planctomycetota bacterium]MDA1112836.1 30S ribosomal protein S14 [Planctomycetota bacterium]
MAKTSAVNREKKRQRLVAVHAERRATFVLVIKDPNATLEEKNEAYKAIQRMPRDASAARLHNRCNITGRPKGYSRRFGISRLVFRRLAHQGQLPGVRKSSW